MKKILFLLLLIPACGFAQLSDATLLLHDSTQIKQLGTSQLRSWQMFKEVIQNKINFGTNTLTQNLNFDGAFPVRWGDTTVPLSIFDVVAGNSGYTQFSKALLNINSLDFTHVESGVTVGEAIINSTGVHLTGGYSGSEHTQFDMTSATSVIQHDKAGNSVFAMLNNNTGTSSTANFSLLAHAASGSLTMYSENNAIAPNRLGLLNQVGEIVLTTPTGSFVGINVAPARELHVALMDATTNSVGYAQRITKFSSGTPSAGIGVGIEFDTQTTGINKVGAVIEAISTNLTSSAEKYDLAFKTMTSGSAATEKFRISSFGGIGLNGANYGTAGDIMTSGGSGAAVSWSSGSALPYWPLTGTGTLTGNFILNGGSHNVKIGDIGGDLLQFTVTSAGTATLFGGGGSHGFSADPTGAFITLGSDATGDTYYRNSGAYLQRIPIGANTYVLTSNGTIPSWQPAAGGGNPFSDATAILKDNSDATKLLRMELGGFTTGTTRVLTPPNFDGIIATTNNAQTISGVQTFSSLPTIPVTPVTSTDAASKGYVDGLSLGPFSTVAAGYTNASGGAGYIIKGDNTGLAPGTLGNVLSSDGTSWVSSLPALYGYTTTVTAAGTTTLTVSSTYSQYFTGTTTQTVVMPVTSTLALGRIYFISNTSTGALTVQSSGANVIQTMAAGSTLYLTCILTSGTTAASWNATYFSNNPMVLAGDMIVGDTPVNGIAPLKRLASPALNYFLTGQGSGNSPIWVYGITGSTTNDTGAAGVVGEPASSLIASGSATSLVTATAKNITSINLTAGDWDVQGNVNFTETTSTVTGRSAGISSSSATIPTDGSELYNGVQSTVTSETNSISLPPKRFSLSGTTTIYLIGSATFSAGACAGFGSLTARRVR